MRRAARLEAIAEEIRAHAGCGFEPCETCTTFVPGEGSAEARIVVVGRLPAKVRCGPSQSGGPSARTSSAVLPNASARVWAKKLARNSSCTSVSPSFSPWAGLATAMKSAGISRVPWWISW